MSADRLSPQLRDIEREIDRYHIVNPLTKRPFAEAVWYFLAACEEVHFLDMMQELGGTSISSASKNSAMADNVIVHSKWPMHWLTQSCPPEGRQPTGYDAESYQDAMDFSRLSMDYLPFESVFSYASWGLVSLTVEGHRLKTAGPMRNDIRFDAYDRLIDMADKLKAKVPETSLLEMIANTVKVKGEHFRYDLNPRIVKVGMESLGPLLDEKFVLPAHWSFPAYTLGDFCTVAKVLWIMAFIHFQARLIAALSRCVGGGYSNALLVLGHEELQQRVRRYSGISAEKVASILKDLTYGTRGQTNPDLALQPLVRLNSSTVAIAPNIMMNLSMERNLSVLLNRFPEERSVYSRLNHERETASRSNAIQQLSVLDLRFSNGHISGWGRASELDLAIISDTNRVCLILELKSFIAPAEAREIVERSEEIAKGIGQINERKKMYGQNPLALHSFLGIDSQYRLTWAVASETSVGACYVQDSTVPVVNLRHLIAHILQSDDLEASCRWLEQGNYLPVDGVDYKSVETQSKIGNWTVEWYGLHELKDDFVPSSRGPL
jgi:hypothetical protein